MRCRTAHLLLPIFLSDVRAGAPMQGVVRGIAVDTPNHQGDKIYYTIATGQAANTPVLGRSRFPVIFSVASRQR